MAGLFYLLLFGIYHAKFATWQKSSVWSSWFSIPLFEYFGNIEMILLDESLM